MTRKNQHIASARTVNVKSKLFREKSLSKASASPTDQVSTVDSLSDLQRSAAYSCKLAKIASSIGGLVWIAFDPCGPQHAACVQVGFRIRERKAHAVHFPKINSRRRRV